MGYGVSVAFEAATRKRYSSWLVTNAARSFAYRCLRLIHWWRKVQQPIGDCPGAPDRPGQEKVSSMGVRVGEMHVEMIQSVLSRFRLAFHRRMMTPREQMGLPTRIRGYDGVVEPHAETFAQKRFEVPLQSVGGVEQREAGSEARCTTAPPPQRHGGGGPSVQPTGRRRRH